MSLGLGDPHSSSLMHIVNSNKGAAAAMYVHMYAMQLSIHTGSCLAGSHVRILISILLLLLIPFSERVNNMLR